MRFYKPKKGNNSLLAYNNFAFTFAKGLMVLLLATLAMMSIQNHTEDGEKPAALFLIETTWPDGSTADVDSWLKLPDGKLVFYRDADEDLVFLERDDRGVNNSVQNQGGSKIEVNTRLEVISIRAVLPGEYIFNVHLFDAHNTPRATGDSDTLAEPLKVKVLIKKMNPTVSIVYQGNVEFTKQHQELHVTRFTVAPDGTIGNFDNSTPVSITNNEFDYGAVIPPEGSVN